MNHFKKRLAVVVVFLFCTGTITAEFWQTLKDHNADKLEAIEFIIHILNAADEKNAAPEVKSFAQEIINTMSVFDARSQEWSNLLEYFNVMIREHKRINMDFRESIKDKEECKRLFESRIKLLTQDAPGIESLTFLNALKK